MVKESATAIAEKVASSTLLTAFARVSMILFLMKG